MKNKFICRKKIKIIFLFILSFTFTLFSCSKNKGITFDTSDPLALELNREWALIELRYVSFRVSPGFDEDIINQGRIGDVLLVQGKKYVKNPYTEETSLWLKFDKGWLNENNIVLYSNKMKAQTAAEKLLSQENQ